MGGERGDDRLGPTPGPPPPPGPTPGPTPGPPPGPTPGPPPGSSRRGCMGIHGMCIRRARDARNARDVRDAHTYTTFGMYWSLSKNMAQEIMNVFIFPGVTRPEEFESDLGYSMCLNFMVVSCCV